MDIKIQNCKNNNTILNTKDWVEYTDDIREVFEKQIPKPLADEWEINNHINGECNICGEIAIQRSKYCSNCGQRLDWS